MQMSVSAEIQETARIAALHSFGVLDTPPEPDFDEIAQLASEICGTPIAVVNLIAEGRQFFKAEVGLGVRETALESSFCAKAILEDEFLVVPDATQDSRFDCNPLVIGEPRLRFYAGALLKTAEGHAIGTVCVLDFKPRTLTPLQERTLRTLARQVMRQLELRRALEERDMAQTQQRVLNQELAHRLKNTLSLVQAIAGQTLKDVEDRAAVNAFERRLLALANAHDVLLQESWSAASIRTVMERVLSLHGDAGRFAIAGGNIRVGPKMTLAMSLLLHELATNAIKHGALSNDRGRVRISWNSEEGADGPEFVLKWEEEGGPPVVEPKRRGFGSRLLRMGLAGTGGTEKTYAPSGFRAVFKAPMDVVRAQ
ncbi:sensor histidine kinase [Enterovirga rhinocerotis]|uniref:histidine kinase n=1 Tax=Enterovirga rhinocerotis TaxID=1339210 RepID=A0A4R7BL35_9HYPH|nr:HWE histidine kinase domain-containing protein [Enterovirga rhinocerotis]TDR85322.1 two-component sensor histidine kinase [Enterovirga rhinocerotis]